jgi:hypothetical protein
MIGGTGIDVDERRLPEGRGAGDGEVGRTTVG